MGSARRIYVDLDDVLSETARAFVILLERHFHKTVPFDEITSFDLALSFGLNAFEYERFMQLAHMPDALQSFEPMEGAAEALDRFISLGYEIAVLTGRPPSTQQVSQDWLETHGIPYHSLTFVDKYGRGGFHTSNPSVVGMNELLEQHFSFAIEDSSAMAVFLASKMNLPVALIDRPWNRKLQVADAVSSTLIARCTDWAGIVEKFGT